MKKVGVLLLFLFCVCGIFAQVKTVAILETVDKEGTLSYAHKLMLRSNLAKIITNTPGYEAYDRTDIDAILTEQNFQRTGVVNDEQIKQIGQIAGAAYILVAEAAKVDDKTLFITAKILNVETSKTDRTDNLLMGTSTDEIYRGCEELAKKLLDITTEGIVDNSPIVEEKLINGHEYVDLGLPSGLLWATCNVGAKIPEHYGSYFAWGECATKRYYDWENYSYGNSSSTLTKYCTKSDYGKLFFSDNISTLQKKDDAARQLWGASWRIPTFEEINELLDYCDWKAWRINNVAGVLVTGPNGNSIFLPHAGYHWGTSTLYEGKNGFYWSATLDSKFPFRACAIQIDAYKHYWSDQSREYGYTIRAVSSPLK